MSECTKVGAVEPNQCSQLRQLNRTQPRSVKGWVRTFDFDDWAFSKRPNRSFTMLDLMRPLDHVDRSLGRGRPELASPGNDH